MCCPFHYVNIWFDMYNIFKTLPVKWYLIYYGYALDIKKYLTCIPAFVLSNSEFNLLAKIMADSLCCFPSKIWLKAVEKVTFMPGFGPLQEPTALCSRRGGFFCLPHQKLLQQPARCWGTLADHARANAGSMCLCHTCPRGYVTFPFQI